MVMGMRAAAWLFLLLSSCHLGNDALGTESIGQNNIYKMRQVHAGMTQEEVYQIMRFPTLDDQIVLDEGCYDIWFYITRGTILGQTDYVRRNLTPIVFRDGVCIGIGYEYYNWVIEKCEEQSAAAAQPVMQPKEEDNEEMEEGLKGLQGPSPGQTPPPSTPTKQSTPKKPSQPAKPATPNNKRKGPGEPPEPMPPVPPPGSGVSMCSKPKQPAPPPPSSSQPTESKDEADEPPLDEEDQRMLREEREENFNLGHQSVPAK